jgi:hypothetical protein
VGVAGELPKGAGGALAFVGEFVAGEDLAEHLVVEEGGFDGGVAAEAPLGGDDGFDEVEFDGVGGLEAEEAAVAEGVEDLGILVIEEEVLVGAEAVGGVVAGGDGLTSGGDGAIGLGSVAAGGPRAVWRCAFSWGAGRFQEPNLLAPQH